MCRQSYLKSLSTQVLEAPMKHGEADRRLWETESKRFQTAFPKARPSNNSGGKHNFFNHFPKDPSFDTCKRTKIKRAPCRRNPESRKDTTSHKNGDVIAAEHKVLGEENESRPHHRYAVVVHDVATQWIQSYPCRKKSAPDTMRVLQRFFPPEWKRGVIHTDKSLEFTTACEDLIWNHDKSTPHRSETNGIVERAVRTVKEGTSTLLVQSELDEQVGSSDGKSLLVTIHSRFLDGKLLTKADTTLHSVVQQ